MDHDPRSEPRRIEIAIAVVLLGVIVARFMLAAITAPEWWGLNLLSFVPSVIAIVITVALAAVVAWPLLADDDHASVLAPISTLVEGNARYILPLIGGVFFFAFPVPVPLLGDASLMGGDLFRYIQLGQPIPLYREPLTMLLASRLGALLARWGMMSDAFVPYRIIGPLCGVLFIGMAQYVASMFAREHSLRTIVVVLLLTCGGTLLFFGYVENYAPQYVFVLIYIAAVLRMFRANGSPWWAAGALAMCCAWHLQNVILIPSFVVALAARRAQHAGTGERFGRRTWRILLASIPLLLLVYAYVQWRPIASSTSPDNPFISLFRDGDNGYTLLSPAHILDIVNEHLVLATVPIVLIVAVLFVASRYVRWRSPEMLVALTCLLGMEAFLVGGNFGYGLARDWDVVVSLGIVLTMIAVLALEDVLGSIPMRPRTIVAASSVAIVGCVVWIVANVTPNLEVARYKSLVDGYRPVISRKATRFGYENLRKMYFHDQNWASELAMNERMIDALPWHFDLMAALKLAREHSPELGPAAGASVARMIRSIVTGFNDSTLQAETAGDEGTMRLAPVGAYPASLGDLVVDAAVELNQSYRTWSAAEVRAFADSLTTLHPRLPYGYELTGWLHLLSRDKAAAAFEFRRAAALADHRSRPYVLLTYCFNGQDERDSANVLAIHALSIDSACFEAVNALDVAMAGAQNDTAKLALLSRCARACLDQAQSRGLAADQVRRIQSIERRAVLALQRSRDQQ